MKQRLVGAVVLVSLAVIFIPMLLDGGDKSGMPTFGSNIPEKPDVTFEPLDIPLEPVTSIPEEKPLLVEKVPPESKTSAKPVEKTPAAKPTAVTQEKAPEPKPLVKKSPAPVPESKPKPAQETIAWVVQVGSFSSADNAMRLRDKLRAKGYKAYVEKLKAGEGTVYRVRIGPELKREDAESKLDALQREMKLKGIVMGSNS
jgi:DedD protein